MLMPPTALRATRRLRFPLAAVFGPQTWPIGRRHLAIAHPFWLGAHGHQRADRRGHRYFRRNGLQSTGNSTPPDAVPRLVTTVNGLASATYNVYAYFWSDQNSSPWRIRAGLTDGTDPLPLFVGGSAPSGSPLPIDTTVRNGAGRILWQASLGTETGTQLKVYIDDAPATTNNERTWYDGVGYQAVPEPGTLVLLALGVPAFMLAARRRKRVA